MSVCLKPIINVGSVGRINVTYVNVLNINSVAVCCCCCYTTRTHDDDDDDIIYLLLQLRKDLFEDLALIEFTAVFVGASP